LFWNLSSNLNKFNRGWGWGYNKIILTIHLTKINNLIYL